MTNQSTWTIGAKLKVFSACFILNLVLIGGISYWNSAKLVTHLHEVSHVQLPAVRNMTLADMMHDGIRANAFHAIIVAGSSDAKELQDVRQEKEEFAKNIGTYLDTIAALPLASEVKQAIADSRAPVQKYVEMAGQVVDLALGGKLDEAMAKLPEFNEQFEQLEKDLEKLGDLISEEAARTDEQGASLATRSSRISLTVLAAALIFGLIFSAWIISDLNRRLREVIGGLTEEAHRVNSTAQSLAASADTLSNSTNQQATAIQETAASMDEITAIATKTRENFGNLQESAEESQKSAAEGQSSVEEMLSAIDVIRDSNLAVMEQVEKGNTQIAEIVQVIGEISEKTKVINDIVFQTKLLSFNASVEAARAGEHGKGFAVVAEEVGNLATMSGRAANEISHMLAGGVNRVEQIVRDNKAAVEGIIGDSKHKIETGTQVAKRCGDALASMAGQAAMVSRMVQEITSSIHEQTKGLEEIGKAIRILDESTTASSTVSQKTAESSDLLLQRASSLSGVVNSLEKLAFGNSQAEAPAQTMPADPESVVGSESHASHQQAA